MSDERKILSDFGKAILDAPLTIVLFILDLAAIAAVLIWVVDDVPEALVVAAFVIVVHVGHYLIFRKMWLRIDEFENAKPSIRFTEVRQAQMYHDSPVVAGRTPTYQITQAWFENKSEAPTDRAIAVDMTARILVLKNGAEVASYHGQWAVSNAPDNVGYDDITDVVTLRPGHLEAKLIVALKYPSDADAYAFARESLRSTPDGRSSRYKIPPGSYDLEVHLLGVGLNKKFAFKLENPGAGHSLALTHASA